MSAKVAVALSRESMASAVVVLLLLLSILLPAFPEASSSNARPEVSTTNPNPVLFESASILGPCSRASPIAPRFRRPRHGFSLSRFSLARVGGAIRVRSRRGARSVAVGFRGGVFVICRRLGLARAVRMAG